MTVDLGLSLAEQCDAILAATNARDRRLRELTRSSPVIQLHDGHMNLQHVVRAENSQEWEDVDNDSAPGQVRIDFAFDEAQWLWDMEQRRRGGETIHVIVTVEHVGRRWSGVMTSAVVEWGEVGHAVLTAHFISDYQQLKDRTLWANPGLPAAFQFPKVFVLGGPTPWVLLTALYLNLKRAHGGPLTLNDPLASQAYTAQNDWPIVVKPISFTQAMADGHVWSVLASRFKSWHEAAEMILADAELSVSWRRWMRGDPPPWPGADLRHGALVIDIVDKSAAQEGTSQGGSVIDGLVRTARRFVNDFLENRDDPIAGLPAVPQYTEPGYLGTDPRVPYVFFGPNHPGLKRITAEWTPAQYVRLTVGGHSMPGVNEIIDAGLQAAGDAIAMIPGAPPLGGALSALLRPIFEDVLLAWISVYLSQRAADSSDFASYERVLESGMKAWTVSSLMVLRAGMVETASKFTAHMEIEDAAPYLVGAPGHGHFDKGDRIVTQVPGDKSGRLHVQRVSKLVLAAERGVAPNYQITMGEPFDPGDPFARLAKSIERGFSIMKELGLW